MFPILNSFFKSEEENGIKHSSEEYSITMFLNALLGFSPNIGSQILERKLNALLNNDLEKFIKQTRILAHPSQMNKYARKFSMEEAENILFEIDKKVLKVLLKQKLIPRKIKIVFDFYKQLYYGEKNNPHVIGHFSRKRNEKSVQMAYVCNHFKRI